MRKRNNIISLVIVAVLLILIYGSGVEAADQSARLKDFIEKTHLYYSTDILSLNEEFRRSRDIFENLKIMPILKRRVLFKL